MYRNIAQSKFCNLTQPDGKKSECARAQIAAWKLIISSCARGNRSLARGVCGIISETNRVELIREKERGERLHSHLVKIANIAPRHFDSLCWRMAISSAYSDTWANPLWPRRCHIVERRRGELYYHTGKLNPRSGKGSVWGTMLPKIDRYWMK